MPKATRKSTICPIIGPPSDLPTAELPTLRQVLQKCLLVKTSSTNQKLPATHIALKVSNPLIKLWTSVHPNIPLFAPDSIRTKVKTSYIKYTLIKGGQERQATSNRE